MKYKRGSIVEVLTKDEVPSHSWRCAQIISCNKHIYTIRYDVYPGFTHHVKEQHVSRKFIRPCPPTVPISHCFPGDVVEVFHNLSWKMAIVSKAFTRDLLLVRLVGSLVQVKASKSELRVRQSWQNNQWVLIGNQNKHNLKQQKDIKEADSVTVTVTSSVGSCSVNDDNDDDDNTYGFEDFEGHDSDGESVCGYEKEEEVCLGTEIHRLELQAYRRTIEALHASGPLSWEKESMVTNLRMSLHISNDEHLIELKNLISSARSINSNR